MSDPVTLAACFMDTRGAEHVCMIRCTGLEDIEVVGGAVPVVCEVLVCRVDGLGVLRGIAGKASRDRFRFMLIAGSSQRQRLAGRLRWHHERASGRADLRQGERIVPDWPDVVVNWAGRHAAGRLHDVSTGGAAITVDPRPAVGTSVTLGRRRGTVVRHTEDGVGVAFVLPLRPEDVREDIIL